MPTTAMVMAAGLGTRMRPLTDHLPKPLVNVAGKPLIDHTLDWLAASGVSRAVVNTHYKADMLTKHIASRTNPHIILSHEETLLETGGGVNHALPLLGDAPFFSTNSDVICIDGKTPALQRLAAQWNDEIDALLLVHNASDAVGYSGKGDFFVGTKGDIRRRAPDETAPYVFTGIQLIHPRLFAQAPEGAFSLNVLYNRDISRIRALVHDGDWLHIGSPKELSDVEDWFLRR